MRVFCLIVVLFKLTVLLGQQPVDGGGASGVLIGVHDVYRDIEKIDLSKIYELPVSD